MWSINDILEWVEDSIGFWRLAALLFALGILVYGGISLFHTPKHEILYGCHVLGFKHEDGARTLMYKLHLGNTGRMTQTVDLVLNGEALQHVVLPPAARNFGVRERKICVTTNGNQLVYQLGEIAPEMEVDFGFTMMMPGDVNPPAWDELLLKVQPARGKAIRGSSGAVKFLRLFYMFFGMVDGM